MQRQARTRIEREETAGEGKVAADVGGGSATEETAIASDMATEAARRVEAEVGDEG